MSRNVVACQVPKYYMRANFECSIVSPSELFESGGINSYTYTFVLTFRHAHKEKYQEIYLAFCRVIGKKKHL